MDELLGESDGKHETPDKFRPTTIYRVIPEEKSYRLGKGVLVLARWLLSRMGR